VERIAPQVVSAAHAVAVNVGDGAAQAHFNAVLSEWQTNVDTLKKSATVAQQPDHVVAASGTNGSERRPGWSQCCRSEEGGAAACVDRTLPVNALHRDIKQVEEATAKKQAQELLNAAEQVIQRVRPSGSAPGALYWAHPAHVAASPLARVLALVLAQATSIVEVVQREIKDNEDAAYQKELNGHLATLNNSTLGTSTSAGATKCSGPLRRGP